ncbi:unnamed protein product [Prorocentrum cordatum]|uniref:Uncharacterized protein n=1 Tax=Prorocentrum cordatum TaxID=2364126 RepID=A0ABN9VWE3_9DINO|nr:unnamed protein product [Polarella glacialis]
MGQEGPPPISGLRAPRRWRCACAPQEERQAGRRSPPLPVARAAEHLPGLRHGAVAHAQLEAESLPQGHQVRQHPAGRAGAFALLLAACFSAPAPASLSPALPSLLPSLAPSDHPAPGAAPSPLSLSLSTLPVRRSVRVRGLRSPECPAAPVLPPLPLSSYPFSPISLSLSLSPPLFLCLSVALSLCRSLSLSFSSPGALPLCHSLCLSVCLSLSLCLPSGSLLSHLASDEGPPRHGQDGRLRPVLHLLRAAGGPQRQGEHHQRHPWICLPDLLQDLQ